MENVEDPDDVGPDLQEEVRKSGATKVDDHTYKTNEGTVILMSPADSARLQLSARLFHQVDRTKKWSEPGYLDPGKAAFRGRGKDE